MPAFNAEAFVAEAIDSVLGQTYPHVELIVVDDGSTDATAAIVGGYGKRVRYLRQQNARQAAARNTGLRHANGPFVAFIDADDTWMPEKLEKQMRRLAEGPAVGFVYCSVEHVDAAGRHLMYRQGRRGRIAQDLLFGESVGGVCGSTILISRARLMEIGDFDVALPPCEDTDFFLRVAARYPLDYVDEPLVKHRLHSSNSHTNLALMVPAWKRLYAKAIRDPSLGRGLRFRARCYGRLYYLLAGEHWHAGRKTAAMRYALFAVMAWPPRIASVTRAIGRRFARSPTGAQLSSATSRRRVLYIAYWGLLEPLGRSLVQPAVEGLADRGSDVHLITFEKARDLADVVALRSARAHLERVGVRWTPLRYHKRPTIPATLFDVAHGFVVGLRATWRARPDVIHGRTFIGGLLGLLLRPFLRAPFVYHNEGFWPDQQVEGGFWRAGSVVYRVTKWIEHRLYERADGLIVLSQRSRPLVLALPGNAQRRPPTVVVPSCVDLDRFRRVEDAATTAAVRLLYLGSLGGRYLIRPMGELMKALRGLGADATLAVVSQSDPEMIRRELAATGLPGNAFEVSRVPHEEVPNRLSRADAGLFFLAGGIGAQSCSPTKTGEYWACGLPVVANPGIGDLDAIVRARQVGVLLPEFTAESYRAAAVELCALLADPDLRTRCRRAAEDFYSLAAGLDEQERLYASLAEPRKDES